MRNLSNISVFEFRSALSALGLHKVRTKGGHEAWMRDGMTRAAVFQTHVSPVPEFIVMNNIRNIGISRADFIGLLENMK